MFLFDLDVAGDCAFVQEGYFICRMWNDLPVESSA